MGFEAMEGERPKTKKKLLLLKPVIRSMTALRLK